MFLLRENKRQIPGLVFALIFVLVAGPAGVRRKPPTPQASPQIRAAVISLYLRDLQRLLPFQSAVISSTLNQMPKFDPDKFSPPEKAVLSLDREALIKLSPDSFPQNPYFDLLAAQIFLYPFGKLTPFLSDREVGSEFLRRASQSDDLWVKWLIARHEGLPPEVFKSNDRLWTLYALRAYSQGKTYAEPLGDEMVSLPSRDPDVLQDLGELLLQLGRKTDARKLFRSALQYLPAAESQRRASLLTKAGDYDEAISQLQVLAETDPANAEIYYLSIISAIDQKEDLTDADRVKKALYYERANRPFSMLEALVIPMAKETRRDPQGKEYEYSYVPEARRQHLPHAVGVIIEEAARIVRAFGVPSTIVKRASLFQTFTFKSTLIQVISPEVVNSRNASAIINSASSILAGEYLVLLRYLDGQCPPELPRSFREGCTTEQALDEDYLKSRLGIPEPQMLQMVAEFTKAVLPEMSSSEKKVQLARLVASALAWRDQPAEAVSLLSTFVTNNSPADLHVELGTYLTAAGKFPEAIKHFRAALSAGYPDRIGVTRQLARALYLNGQLREALDTLQSVLTMTPDALEAYSDALLIALERKAYKTALNILANMAIIDPQNDLSYRRKRIEILAKLGRTDEMVKELSLYFERTRDDGFISDLAAALAPSLKDPPNPSGFPLWDGWLYFHYYSQAKEVGGALPIIEQITRMIPEYIPFRERLGHLYARLSRFGEAAKVFGDLARSDPYRSEDYKKLEQFYGELAQSPSSRPSG